MIELEINGKPRTIHPTSMQELESEIERPVPQDHAVCRLLVNGREIERRQLAEYDLANVRQVRIESAPLASIALGAVEETSEWIGRICGVLDSVAEDYRFGREADANGRLASVIDALQVLVHLLGGIHTHAPIAAPERDSFSTSWQDAEVELRSAIDDIGRLIEAHDGVGLADVTGYTLPRCLASFRTLLEQVRR
jgi:hypothetical protein